MTNDTPQSNDKSSDTSLSTNTQKLVNNPAALCNIIRRIALRTGDLLLDFYDNPASIKVENKADGSPVSIADKQADDLIRKALSDLTPEIPIISEENDNQKILKTLNKAEYFWLVDPIDGTADFIQGGEDFSVNIALIHKNQPIIGIVYAPATGILYAGNTQNGAIKWSEDSQAEKPITVRTPPHKGLTVVTSKTTPLNEAAQKFIEDFKINKIIRKASSIKMCLIAEGKADIYPRFGNTYEWDTAAAHAILNAAGGYLTNLDGQPLTYGHTDKNLLNPSFIACNFKL